MGSALTNMMLPAPMPPTYDAVDVQTWIPTLKPQHAAGVEAPSVITSTIRRSIAKSQAFTASRKGTSAPKPTVASSAANTSTPSTFALPSMLAAYFAPCKTSRYAMLYSHGNAEDLGHNMADFFCKLLQINVLVYDYQGYGQSAGYRGESEVYDSIEAARKWLNGQGFPNNKIILVGRSVGTGPTVHEAARQPAASCFLGVMLISPLLSAFRVGLGRTLPFDKFCNIDKIGKIECPVFILHGDSDEVVPFAHGQELHKRCKKPFPPWWMRHIGHNNIGFQDREFRDKVAEFFGALGVYRED